MQVHFYILAGPPQQTWVVGRASGDLLLQHQSAAAVHLLDVYG